MKTLTARLRSWGEEILWQKSMFSSPLCVNTIFTEMNGSHWLEKNFLLNEGFDNSVNKICHSRESQWYCVTLALRVLAICLHFGMISSVEFTNRRQQCKQLYRGMEIPYQVECSFLSKAKISCSKQLPKGQTCDPKPCIIDSQ